MISTMIIDDNKIIREHFQKLIDWESVGFKLVSIASNGILGWQDFNKYKPQLVITDVQMPGMTGIELAKRIKEISPDTMIVFISNYEDFNYLKAAMNLGVHDYILKHETRGEIFYKKLKDIRFKIEESIYNKRSYHESKLILAFSSDSADPLFKDDYSLVLLEQASVFPAFLELLNVIDDKADENKVKSICYSFSQEITSVIKLDTYRYAFLIKTNSKLDDLIIELHRLLQSQTNMNFYFLILFEDQQIKHCFNKYISCKNYTNYKYFTRKECIIKCSLLNDKNNKLDFSEIINAANAMDADKVCKLFDDYYRLIMDDYNYEVLMKLTKIILDVLISNQKEVIEEDFELYNDDDLKFWLHADEIIFWLKNKLLNLMRLMESNPLINYSSKVKAAIEYISNNYMTPDLTVGDIADHVDIDANSLNKLTKEETGQTIIKLLTNVRIEKAKEMISKNKKIATVCRAVGYANISYFSNVFKKVCGESPLEYRRRTNEKDN